MKKLFTNGVFHLLNDEKQNAKAIIVDNGKIIEIYPAALPSLQGMEYIDLKGCHVFPGFIDTHTHSFEGGLYSQSIDLSKVKTLAEVLAKLDAYYQQCDKAEIEEIDAFRFDENKIKEQRFPTEAELNSVCPNISLVLRRVDGHSSAVNSLAWKKFTKANPEHAKLESKRDSVLRGALNDKVVHWFHQNLSEQTVLSAYHQASEIAAANGFTTIHTMVGDAQNSIMHYKFLQNHLEQFGVEFILYPQSFNLKAALEVGATRIGGCILADGALGSHTAALRQPYTDDPASEGTLYHDNSFWEKFITEATGNNMQVAVHCIGDKAIKQINDVYLKLYKKHKHDLRHELIHCELTPDDLVEEIVKSHAVPVMQGAFDLYWGADDGFYHKVLGERYKQMNRFRTFKDKGVTITGGSDWYITELDALQGIRAAVQHHNPLERLDIYAAIDMYTKNAAWLSHDEHRLGQLSIGYDADFVCLSADILTDTGLATATVQATYKQGKQIYSTNEYDC